VGESSSRSALSVYARRSTSKPGVGFQDLARTTRRSFAATTSPSSRARSWPSAAVS